MSTIKTVAVTGATGFVGRYVVKALLARGFNVRALVRDREKARRVLPSDKSLSLIVGSVLNPDAAMDLLRGVQACVHLVGIIRAAGSQTFRRMHVDATKVMVDACRVSAVKRFVHMSAIGVTIDGKAEYQRTKAEAEQIVRRSGLEWTVFRPGVIHGPDSELVSMIRKWCTGSAQPFLFIPYFSRAVEHDEPVWMSRVTFESARCAPVSVVDVARAFAESLDRPQAVGEVYNLVGSEELEFKKMLEWFRDHLPRADASLPVLGVPGPIGVAKAKVAAMLGMGGLLPFDEGQAQMAQEDSTASLDKVRAHLGFEPSPFGAVASGYVGSMV